MGGGGAQSRIDSVLDITLDLQSPIALKKGRRFHPSQ